MELFSSICAYGTTTVLVHSHQPIAKSKPTLFSTAVDSFYRVNTLYDGTVNCFSTLAQSSKASNEMFTYKQALWEPDYHDFIKAMVHEVEDHKSRDHWTCMQCSDMPENTKTIMSIGVLSKSGTQMGSLTSTRLVSDLMVVCKLGAPIIVRPVHQLLTGSVFVYSWQTSFEEC